MAKKTVSTKADVKKALNAVMKAKSELYKVGAEIEKLSKERPVLTLDRAAYLESTGWLIVQYKDAERSLTALQNTLTNLLYEEEQSS